MIRLLLTGGIGNQLFQYAALRAQAKRIAAELTLDLQFSEQGPPGDVYSFWLQTLPIRAQIQRYPESGLFSVHGLGQRIYRKTLRPLRWRRYNQPPWENDGSFFDIRSRTIVSGYFQSLFYLLPRDEAVMSELDMRVVAPPPALDLAKEFADDKAVSVHIRRAGEYANVKEFNHLDYSTYIPAAMEMMRERLGTARFVVFSDDIAWCRTSPIFGRDCEFVETDQFGTNPAIDLFLMSSCRHHIVANSSYSWWAAWAGLGDGNLCILPKYWTRDRTTEEHGLVHPTWLTV